MDQDRQALAADVWRRLFGFFMSTRHQRDTTLERLRLTPNDARAFYSLSEAQGRTMRSLAEEWGCDASNATWIVDRLEKRGFAERQTPKDRRVKLVVLTALGAKTRSNLLQSLTEPPPQLLSLSDAQLKALSKALRPLGDDAEVPSPDTRASRD
ncbi:MAG TPA: MarR family transcriptional regulator [Dehalococcoidia bacterium]|nr:MarR family transcriptional regulator [Dehalococcoidia bacterium]